MLQRTCFVKVVIVGRLTVALIDKVLLEIEGLSMVHDDLQMSNEKNYWKVRLFPFRAGLDVPICYLSRSNLVEPQAAR